MRVLVFGDSITQGFWDTEGGWVERLRKYYDELQVQNLRVRDDPTIFNLGISADTSQNILHRIEHETIVRTRHGISPVIVVQIGVNDSSKHGKETSVPPKTYKANLKAIIQKAQPISSKIIFVGLSGCDESQTTPTFWGDYYYDNASIKQYEDAMAQVAADNNVPFIPVFDAFMQAATKDNTLLPDGLHPSNDGHKVIFEIVQPKLLTYLKED